MAPPTPVLDAHHMPPEMLKTLTTCLMAAVILISTPAYASGITIKTEDVSSPFGRLESCVTSGGSGESLVFLFTSVDGSTLLGRLATGQFEVLMPSTSLFVVSAPDGSARLSRAINGVASTITYASSDVVAGSAAPSAKAKPALHTLPLPDADRRLLASFQSHLDGHSTSAKMRMSGQCWLDLVLTYILIIAAVAVCVGALGWGCLGAVAGGLGTLSSFWRSCGPAANYGMPRDLPTTPHTKPKQPEP